MTQKPITPRVKRAARRAQRPTAQDNHDLQTSPSSADDAPDNGNEAKRPKPPTREEQFIALMRCDGGATAQTLAEALGWQLHSVRGFISGKLKKRKDLVVTTARSDGATRYAIADAKAVGS